MQSEQFEFCPKFDPTLAEIVQQNNMDNSPFYHPAFFTQLESSSCVAKKNGWQPRHLKITSPLGQFVVPGYLKDHSFGEYLFDWSLAESIQALGIRYFPKWVMQFPFTPVTFPQKLLPNQLVGDVLDAIIEDAVKGHRLMAQLLYVPESWLETCRQHSGAIRYSLQFLWQNKGYSNFEELLSYYARKNAKNIRYERRKVNQLNYVIRTYQGAEISEEVIRRFYPFYKHTYLKLSGHSGYLTLSFFIEWLLNIKDRVFMVFAQKDQQDIAGALMLCSNNTLYGRYWGSYHDDAHLHFECCYYQGMELCIQRKLKYFHPGVQGTHKVRRGFEPILVPSCYLATNRSLHHALTAAFESEMHELTQYKNTLISSLPFKPTDTVRDDLN